MHQEQKPTRQTAANKLATDLDSQAQRQARRTERGHCQPRKAVSQGQPIRGTAPRRTNGARIHRRSYSHPRTYTARPNQPAQSVRSNPWQR